MRPVLPIAFCFLSWLISARANDWRPLSPDETELVLGQIGRREKIDPDFLARGLISENRSLRTKAAARLGKEGAWSTIPLLIGALSEVTIKDAVCPPFALTLPGYWANESLKAMSGQDFGFYHNAPKTDRDVAIEKWKQWFASCPAELPGNVRKQPRFGHIVP